MWVLKNKKNKALNCKIKSWSLPKNYCCRSVNVFSLSEQFGARNKNSQKILFLLHQRWRPFTFYRCQFFAQSRNEDLSVAFQANSQESTPACPRCDWSGVFAEWAKSKISCDSFLSIFHELSFLFFWLSFLPSLFSRQRRIVKNYQNCQKCKWEKKFSDQTK